jgi:hypothetical protein
MPDDDPPFKAGDRVIFLVDFSRAGVSIPPGTLGEVTRDGPPIPGTGFQFVSIMAKRRLWLCKPSEIRKVDAPPLPSPGRLHSPDG